MLTHGNIVADVAAAVFAGLKLTPEDVHLSYLPLAHMFERIVQAAVWSEGCSVGFYQGNTAKLMDDIAALRPTLFPSVPRYVPAWLDGRGRDRHTHCGTPGAQFPSVPRLLPLRRVRYFRCCES